MEGMKVTLFYCYQRESFQFAGLFQRRFYCSSPWTRTWSIKIHSPLDFLYWVDVEIASAQSCNSYSNPKPEPNIFLKSNLAPVATEITLEPGSWRGRAPSAFHETSQSEWVQNNHGLLCGIVLCTYVDPDELFRKSALIFFIIHLNAVLSWRWGRWSAPARCWEIKNEKFKPRIFQKLRNFPEEIALKFCRQMRNDLDM